MLYKTFKIVSTTLFCLYVVVPFLMYMFPHVHHSFLFMHFAKWPFTNYSDPVRLGVKYPSRNFYLKSENDVAVGVWQVLPKALNASSSIGEKEFERLLSTPGYPVIVYFHGNTWSRSAPHRIALYNVLSLAGYHVLALDYRGYGDSTGAPSEDGVVRDAIHLYKWAKNRAGDNPVFVWGHSLGTAIGTKASKDLCAIGKCPQGLVLESPFNNLGEIIRHHPLTIMFRWLPWFDKFMVEPFQHLGVFFNSDDRIKHVDCPILIMHAKDDRVVPFKLAVKLKEEAVKGTRDVTFIEFEIERNFGHKYICSAPELPDIIYEFFQRCLRG